MEEPSNTLRPVNKAAWCIAYLISPAAPFICLWYARAISGVQCLSSAVTTLFIQIGLLNVLGSTNGDPLQPFIVLLLGTATYLIYGWQYLCGQRVKLWSPEALKTWRFAGRFFGVFIALGMVANIAAYQLQDPNSQVVPWIKSSLLKMFTH